MQTSTELIAFLCLYLGNQQELYLEDHAKALALANWLVPKLAYEFPDNKTFGPDICAYCLTQFGTTLSGRVRFGCCMCTGSRCLAYWWPGRLSEKFKIPDATLEMHLADALLLCKGTIWQTNPKA